MTRILKNSVELSLQEAAHHLTQGGLVAFPTETVYGLGADARSKSAVRSIYEVKRRPATDPLIVHVPSVAFAEDMIHPTRTTPWQRLAMRALADAFWPGPLTMILPAHPNHIAYEVTSGTGLVGLRRPAHALAQKFLEQCQVPVAAPSANLFGHVSPTTAEHVLCDFPDVDNLWILDGGQCGFGIESTVARLNENETVDVLRRGGVG
ncbi:threonylcarbamoyl-AMP synthase, partial [bacterium]|nr:threonylcarbamoyl-AMP synthase [bacterium]